ncbi:TIM-barrel domain-containing protein [Mucilaginibacter lacusdianchii]|uniref:TIM-barrel domain-containing protein n=1 Tax=Mucilaginibacter lacusdianchii TaxID=2684211 RepID=UPI00131BDC45|nr:TIM-barrel domain-containing protein [Mucilaginibacter sp. JXJ CY 39]
MTVSLRYHLSFLFLIICTAVEARPVPVSRSGLVGNAIAEFIPVGFDISKTPSLILQKEPQIKSSVPADWGIVPEFSVNDGKASAVVRLKGDVSLYGGGEVTGPLLRNGQTIKLWNTDNGAYGTDNGKRLYQTHPWVLGVRKDGTAFGVLFDSSWKAELTTNSDKIEYNAEGGALFRVFVINRKSPQEVLKGLAELTGTMAMPPRWALGYHQCRFSYGTEEKVRSIANTFREKNIPCDAIWMDIDYMEGYRVFTFNNKNFPNPKKLNDDLHQKGFKSVYMIDPGVKVDKNYWVYQSGTANDVWVKQPDGKEYHGKVWPGDCAFPDFTMPRTRKWWSGLYKDFVSTGIDGIWNDMNEPAVNDNELAADLRLGTMPYNTPHRGGGNLPAGNHLLYHNAYGRFMVEASRNGILAVNPEKRPFILTRANLLGGQRYAATWTGDNLADPRFMKVSVPMSITLGLSGQPFSGPDIGGFLENTSGELWAQWIGFGTLLPFARGHACAGTNDKEPWAFGPEIENTSRIALERRYRLLPYLYTLFYKAHTTGLPIMSPVFFADLKDARLRSEEQAFMLGSNLLVVPAFAKNPALPTGIWENLHLINGEETDAYQAKLLIKGGSIIPAGKVIQNTEEKSLDKLTLYVCLDSKGQANGELYWDAGDGRGFNKGNNATLKFHAATQNGATKISLASQSGKYPVNNEIKQINAVIVKNGKAYYGSGNLKTGVIIKSY